MPSATTSLLPLRHFLEERGWPQRVSAYDQYGGPGMFVQLEPPPSPEQLAVLIERFPIEYEFGAAEARLHEGPG